jgi:Fe-S cluster assembly iron-binding protein IscA
MTLEESKNDDDYFNETNGIKVLVEKDLLKQFKGFKIDYSNSWLTKGFRIIPGAGGSRC